MANIILNVFFIVGIITLSFLAVVSFFMADSEKKDRYKDLEK